MIPLGADERPCGCHDCTCPGCYICDGEPDNAGPDYPLDELDYPGVVTSDPWRDELDR